MSTSQRFLRITDVAERLNVSLQRAYDLARQGLIPVVRIGRQIRIDPEALDAWVQGGGQALPADAEVACE